MTFRIGQKVVCVTAFRAPSRWQAPAVNSIYTVGELVGWPNGLGYSIRLTELRNPPVLGFEPAFSADHFRPVVKRKTDISVFTEILRTTKAPTARNRTPQHRGEEDERIY